MMLVLFSQKTGFYPIGLKEGLKRDDFEYPFHVVRKQMQNIEAERQRTKKKVVAKIENLGCEFFDVTGVNKNVTRVHKKMKLPPE